MSVGSVELRPGARVSRIIKGGWQLAGDHGPVDRARAVRDMAAFLDAGVTCFDCADIYTGVEEMIGEFIARVRRERGAGAARAIRVHTKLVPDLSRLDTFSEADAEAIIDRSLMRLGVERLHLVQAFWWDFSRGRPVEVLASLARLQEKGKIEHVGATNWDAAPMEALIGAGLDLVSAQVQYSLLDARPEGRFAKWCAARRVAIFCYGVLAGGFLSENWLGRPDPGHDFENRSLIKYRLIIDEFGGWDLFQELLRALDRAAKRHDADIAAVAGAWMLARPEAAAVIIGARTARDLHKTLRMARLRLSDEDRAEIGAVLARRKGPSGPVYGLESDRAGRHGRIMKYDLNTRPA